MISPSGKTGFRQIILRISKINQDNTVQIQLGEISPICKRFFEKMKERSSPI
jgi:hypothetical protein